MKMLLYTAKTASEPMEAVKHSPKNTWGGGGNSLIIRSLRT